MNFSELRECKRLHKLLSPGLVRGSPRCHRAAPLSPAGSPVDQLMPSMLSVRRLPYQRSVTLGRHSCTNRKATGQNVILLEQADHMSQVPISDSTSSIASSPNIDLMQVAPLLKNTSQVVELAEPAYSAILDPTTDAPWKVLVPRHDGTRASLSTCSALASSGCSHGRWGLPPYRP